jgi:hypothetical protein
VQHVKADNALIWMMGDLGGQVLNDVNFKS